MNGDEHPLLMRVNGRAVRSSVAGRTVLADWLREHLGLTGTHIGCGQGLCGSCTVLVDGRSTRACLTLAVQVDGTEVVTIEGLNASMPSEVQAAFLHHQALQCGFCTPGFIVVITELLAEVDTGARPSRADLLDRLAACLCRCTGYAPILAATEDLVARRVAGAVR